MTPEQWKQERVEAFEQWSNEELKEWREIAGGWATYKTMDESACRCIRCNQSIYFVYDMHGEHYTYTEDEILALKIAHIRQVHANVKDQNG